MLTKMSLLSSSPGIYITDKVHDTYDSGWSQQQVGKKGVAEATFEIVGGTVWQC